VFMVDSGVSGVPAAIQGPTGTRLASETPQSWKGGLGRESVSYCSYVRMYFLLASM